MASNASPSSGWNPFSSTTSPKNTGDPAPATPSNDTGGHAGSNAATPLSGQPGGAAPQRRQRPRLLYGPPVQLRQTRHAHPTNPHNDRTCPGHRHRGSHLTQQTPCAITDLNSRPEQKITGRVTAMGRACAPSKPERRPLPPLCQMAIEHHVAGVSHRFDDVLPHVPVDQRGAYVRQFRSLGQLVQDHRVQLVSVANRDVQEEVVGARQHEDRDHLGHL